jgi:hypothetical protein
MRSASTRPSKDVNMGATLNAALYWWITGDAAALNYAKTSLNQSLWAMVSSTGCDTGGAVPATTWYCGNPDNSDYPRLYYINAMQAYSIVRSQMTAAERANFAAMWLNDNDSDHNGLNPQGAGCVQQAVLGGVGTLTAAGKTITISGGTTSQLTVGAVLTSVADTHWWGTVVSITDATHFVLDTGITLNSAPFRFTQPWNNTNCGLVWLAKHHRTSPALVPGQESHCYADYGMGCSDTIDENYSNTTLTALFGFISVGVGLADDDPRAVTLLQQAYNHFWQHQYGFHKSTITPFSVSADAYTQYRTHWCLSGIGLMMKNSGGPDITDGMWFKRIGPYWYYAEGLSFGDIYTPIWGADNALGLLVSLSLYPNSDEAQYGNYWLRNLYNSVGGGPGDFMASGLNYGGYYRAGLAYILLDPNAPQKNVNNAPKQYLFQDTDANICVANGVNCYANRAFTHAVSHTGWGPADTRVLLQAAYNDTKDHSGYGDWGSVHIVKNNVYLLAGDGNWANFYVWGDNMIDLNAWVSPGYSSISRWGGPNPSGDPNSRYTYALMDISGAYAAAAKVSRVHRHVVHFKNAGAQDYIVWYDDIAVQTPTTIKALLHFYHADCYTLNSCTAGASGITWGGGNDGGTVSNTQAGAKLLTTVLSTAGVRTALLGRDKADGTYDVFSNGNRSGGNGYTYRAYVCAENASAAGSCDANATKGEWIVVHKPATDGNATMPPISQPAATNFRVVQIADDISPKVAVFAAGGGLQTSAAFTTTHAGTAQYVITGIAPGFYDVFAGASRIASRVGVRNGDGTLYFEGPAAAYQIRPSVTHQRGSASSQTRQSAPIRRQ